MVMDLQYELSCSLLSLHGRILSCFFRIIVMFFDGHLELTQSLTVSSGPVVSGTSFKKNQSLRTRYCWNGLGGINYRRDLSYRCLCIRLKGSLEAFNRN